MAAAAAAFQHCRRHGDTVPALFRGLYALFAILAVFVALEELSYGQHLLGYEAPEWFQHHNKQDELNVHNLHDNAASDGLRLVTNIGFPAFCIALPLLYRGRSRAWKPGHWTYYLLPRTELITLAGIAQLVTVPDKIPFLPLDYYWTDRLGELKEFYWSLTAIAYIRLIARRHNRTARLQPASDEIAGDMDEPARRAGQLRAA